MKKSVVSKTALTLALIPFMAGCASVSKLANPAPKDLPQGRIVLTPGSYSNMLSSPAQSMASSGDYAKQTSLWGNSPNSLFGDRRASQTGDILTVLIEIDEEAEMQNSSAQSTSADNTVNLNALLGLSEIINNVLPAGASLSPGIDLSRSRNTNGDATIRRGEKISLSLALQVEQVLANGYMSIAGRQDIMVNNEARHLQVTGLVRPEDISRQNVITYDKIANAKIYYGGTGEMSWTVGKKPFSQTVKSLAQF